MNITGVIDSKRRDGKGIKIGADWYTVMFSSVLDGFDRGDNVEVEYTTKPSPAGPDYRNIKSIKKAVAPASRPVPAATGAGGFGAARTFPVPAFSPERAIIRQNSITNAVKAFAGIPMECAEFDNHNDLAEAVIDLARRFEAYSAGDLDRDIVEKEVKAMLAKETS